LAAALAELIDAIRAELDAAAPAHDAPDRLLSVPEAAAAMGVGRTTVYAEMQAGRMRSVKVGRRRLIPASVVAEYGR
jgi:excisionase family DNA binding protein